MGACPSSWQNKLSKLTETISDIWGSHQKGRADAASRALEVGPTPPHPAGGSTRELPRRCPTRSPPMLGAEACVFTRQTVATTGSGKRGSCCPHAMDVTFVTSRLQSRLPGRQVLGNSLRRTAAL